MSGIATYLREFEDPKDAPPATKGESKAQRLVRKTEERATRASSALAAAKAAWHPKDRKEGDPYKTLFLGRLSFDTSESKLRREMEVYGEVRSVVMIKDEEGKPRGQAFVEFEHESDMRAAFKRADGQKIDGRRIVVDVERGRTVEDWLPRRLGKGAIVQCCLAPSCLRVVSQEIGHIPARLRHCT